jgi:hypothetical protein
LFRNCELGLGRVARLERLAAELERLSDEFRAVVTPRSALFLVEGDCSGSTDDARSGND